MTRLEAAIKAFISYYKTKYPLYALYAEDEDRIPAMQAALEAADAWKAPSVPNNCEIEIYATYIFDDRTEKRSFKIPADVWNGSSHTSTEFKEPIVSRRSLAQSFIEYFAEEFRKLDHSKGDVDPHTMSRIIGVALENAFDERERK